MTAYWLGCIVFTTMMCAIFLQRIGDKLHDIWLVMRRNEEVAKITREYERTLSARPKPPYGPPPGNIGTL